MEQKTVFYFTVKNKKPTETIERQLQIAVSRIVKNRPYLEGASVLVYAGLSNNDFIFDLYTIRVSFERQQVCSLQPSDKDCINAIKDQLAKNKYLH